jgi:hypothetical protein
MGRDLEVVGQDVVEGARDGRFLHPFRWFPVQDVWVATLDLEERSRNRSQSVGVRTRKALDLEVGCPFLAVKTRAIVDAMTDGPLLPNPEPPLLSIVVL